MPTDTLGDEVQAVLKGAVDFLRLNRSDDRKRRGHLTNLESMEARLRADIQERETTYADELQSKEDSEIDAEWRELNEDRRFVRINTEQKGRQQTFEDLRQINDGEYPKDISPVIYIIPLIGVGIAEWYVNISTFSARYVPLVAGAGTIIIALIFAAASHFQGEALKQISEILHPSAVYRKELGRKIIVFITTIFLLLAFLVIIFVRYQVIADQLGLSSESGGTFSGSSSSIVWSNLTPTIYWNLGVWGLGLIYAYLASERVPKLRDAFRDLRRSNKKLDKARRPFLTEQKRIKAEFDRERKKNEVAIKEYNSLSEEVRGAIKRLQS
jgi:hypothetical protein